MRIWHMVLFATILLTSTWTLAAGSETDKSGEAEHKDRPELQECRDINKGKWCTCRKLLKFVEKKIGKVLGIYIPQCGRFKPKLFLPRQCSGAKCWCVSPKSGRMIAGSLREDAEAVKVKCDDKK